MDKLLTLLILITLGACATWTPPSSTRSSAPSSTTQQKAKAQTATPNVNLSGFPVAFREGYGQGCNAAKSGSKQKDDKRYKADSDYADGWQDGYAACKR